MRKCPACGSSSTHTATFCGSCGGALNETSKPAPANPKPAEKTFANGRYRTIRLLGEGGSKIVYLAEDTVLGRKIAFCLIKTTSLDAAGRTRLEHEARAMAELGDHPHIVSVYDLGREGNAPFIVMQFMAGGSVDWLLKRSHNNHLPVPDALRIADEVCQALEDAHSRGVIHRDVKPASVFLTEDGTSKLGDFGLALGRDVSRITMAGMMVGTASYMSPEQASGRDVGPQSDLHSLGAMLYEMLSGRPPFVSQDLATIVTQLLTADPRPPGRHNPMVVHELDDLVLRLLAKNLYDRPRNASSVLAELRAISSQPSTIEAPASTVVLERPDLGAAASPDGMVSILFSDIENSTAMTERLGDLRAREIIHDHNAIIDRLTRRAFGHVVKTMGDGFMISFASARHALECAISIRREMTAYSAGQAEWPLRVRIGLHVGGPLREGGGDFFGTMVNMAARIGAKAESGQILVSATLKEVTETLGEFSFGQARDLELKGFAGLHRVFEVRWRPDGATRSIVQPAPTGAYAQVERTRRLRGGNTVLTRRDSVTRRRLRWRTPAIAVAAFVLLFAAAYAAATYEQQRIEGTLAALHESANALKQERAADEAQAAKREKELQAALAVQRRQALADQAHRAEMARLRVDAQRAAAARAQEQARAAERDRENVLAAQRRLLQAQRQEAEREDTERQMGAAGAALGGLIGGSTSRPTAAQNSAVGSTFGAVMGGLLGTAITAPQAPAAAPTPGATQMGQ
jgi:serine/threonine protein kinase